MLNFMDFIMMAAALYIGYHWYLLKFKRVIKTGLMLGTDVNVERCKDKEAYMREADKPLMFLGIVSIVEASTGLINSYVTRLPLPVSMGILMVFLAYLVWFVTKSNELYKKYWDPKPKVTVGTRKRF